jgi:hypothetical protein
MGEPLPAQFYTINSEASTDSLETKAVEVTRTHPYPPSIFDFVLFTQGSLVK